MTETDELQNDLDTINAERIRRKSTAQERKSNREAVARHRAKNNDPLLRLRERWEEALSKLPAEQRAALVARNEEVAELVEMMHDCFKGRFIYPDICYEEIKRAGTPLTSAWSPSAQFFADLTKLYPEAASQWADPEYRGYGLRLYIPDFSYDLFLEFLILWADKNPGECDPQILAEVVDLVDQYKRTLPDYEPLENCSVDAAIMRYRAKQSGSSITSVSAPTVQIEGLTMTQKAETLQTEAEIRRAVLGR